MTNTTTTAAPQPRPVRNVVKSTARADLARIEAASSPWWTQAPDVFLTCWKVIVAPFDAVAKLMTFIVEAAFVTVGATLVAWYLGYIPESVVTGFLNSLGTRVLSIIQHSGIA